MQRTSFLILLSLLGAFGVSACAGKTLDGGSTGDTAGAGTGQGADEHADENGHGSTEGVDLTIPDAPVTGKIAGQSFEAKTIDLAFSKRENQWFLSIHNYEIDCGTLAGTMDAAEAMVVNIGAVAPQAGTFTITRADGHGASLQLGVYDTTKKSDTRVVENGSFRLDNWDETPGATVTGGLKLLADDESAVAGTFTAKVCAPR
jgi:hypothetical protein